MVTYFVDKKETGGGGSNSQLATTTTQQQQPQQTREFAIQVTATQVSNHDDGGGAQGVDRLIKCRRGGGQGEDDDGNGVGET